MIEIVDVILPVYKEEIDFIKKSVCSILNQTYKNIHLIVVVDNPNNIEAINFLKSIEGIDLILNNENIGLVKSLNNGLKHCIGKYVARMDADDISEPNRIEKQVFFLEKNNLDIVGCNVRWFNDEKVFFESKLPIHYKKVKKSLRVANCVYHPTFLFKRDVLHSVIRYENIPFCEDYCFLLNCLIKGYKIGNHPEILLNYRWNKNGISYTNSVNQRINSIVLKKLYKKKEFITEDIFKISLGNMKFNKGRINSYYLYKNEIKTKNIFLKVVISLKIFIICPKLFLSDLYIRVFIRRKHRGCKN